MECAALSGGNTPFMRRRSGVIHNYAILEGPRASTGSPVPTPYETRPAPSDKIQVPHGISCRLLRRAYPPSSRIVESHIALESLERFCEVWVGPWRVCSVHDPVPCVLLRRKRLQKAVFCRKVCER